MTCCGVGRARARGGRVEEGNVEGGVWGRWGGGGWGEMGGVRRS